MRLLLFSDLHLEAGFAWAPAEVGRARRDALRECLRRIIGLAASLRVDAVCCGGDLYEDDRHRPDTGAFLQEAFASLDPVPVFIAPGNHDWFGPESIYARQRWSPNVHVFAEQRLSPVPLADGLTLWGAAHHSPKNAPNFLDAFQVDRGGVHLALFHGSEMGSFDTGVDVRHAPFRAAQLGAAGLHHALLGHFHAPRAAADHTYPGNPDPLAFGETGERGPVSLTVGADGSVTREWHRVAVSSVHDVVVGLDGVTHADAVQDRVDAALDGLVGTVRVTLRGEVAPEVAVDAARLRRPPGIDAWVVRVGDVSYGYDLDALAEEQTVRGQFVRDVMADPSLDAQLRRRILTTGLRALDGRADLAVV